MKSNKYEIGGITMNYVVESYENYQEENRLTTNNARKIEFLTTTRVFKEVIGAKSKILDCAAGTGIYAFWLADRGHDVTATDITPRHIDIINSTLFTKEYSMNTKVLDATDMSCFGDESFDVVLNMGPFYHLTDENKREKCLKECLRVLKKGGLLITAYIPRYFVFQYIAIRDENQFRIWCDYHYSVCREQSTLGASNHVVIIGRK